MPDLAVIIVHGGAGVHPVENAKNIERGLRRACKAAISRLSRGGSLKSDSHVDMIEAAISELENDPSMNAGFGSNLTQDGTVECDASIMEGSSGSFGSVGAVSGVRNPIQVARKVMEYSQRDDKLRRVPPMTLVSDGAQRFALLESLSVVHPASLVSAEARQRWQKWKDRLASASEHGHPEENDLNGVQDTVGAAAWSRGNAAAGVSSGGLLLKLSGRIGEAAVFGAGCWAQHFPKARTFIACSISGTGEYIMRAGLAGAIGDAFNAHLSAGQDADPHEILSRVLSEKFLDAQLAQRNTSRLSVGIILLITEVLDEGVTLARLWCAFTTPSMAIAYATSKSTKPKHLEAQIIRRPENARKTRDDSRLFITAITL